MGESFDDRLANLKSILTNYNNVDRQYIADKLSDYININYKNVNFNLSYQDVINDSQLTHYLNDKVYASILKAINDLKEYRALQFSLFKSNSNTTTDTNIQPSNNIIINPTPGNGQLNAQFNLAFEQQLDKNHMQRLLEEEKKLSELMDNNQYVDKNIKLFHTLTFAEIVDNLSNSIITLFKQVYTLDINGFMKSQDNYIYYGITFIFIYIIFKVIYQELIN
jgi:hypothetical protein